MTTYDEGGLGATDRTVAFEAERTRLERLAARVLGDPAEAEDVVQQAWLRLHGTDADITNLPAWLTTVTTRLCLDRLWERCPCPRRWTSTSRGGPCRGRGQRPGGRAGAR